MYIEREEQLRELYAPAKGRSLDKQLDALEKHSINFIEHSPFVTVSTASSLGKLDCSPRGGKPGFIKVLNNSTLLIPDAKGNNRLDSLSNIIETGNIGCLFLIPGVDETLRVNGTARLSTSPEHLNLFTEDTKAPITCIELAVTEVFLHCAKALMRSKLWSLQSQIERSSFPTMGLMINEQLSVDSTPESQEEMVMRYLNDL
ncbi:pyridoxamine 5'-phosphate oxidase family protein [Shewanella sp. UCD-KL12]|uniref:pyridoxamine 5'-phosphate oxidase family protein n=1 Tax=Shewanella sp. UCD-KL12 TaxID=1917163 RepID=UPI000970F738|nr:pyridoxamine 5'-phosphate oxidase family protein [Shewanella sp. UCD-KL12]